MGKKRKNMHIRQAGKKIKQKTPNNNTKKTKNKTKTNKQKKKQKEQQDQMLSNKLVLFVIL